MGKNREITGPPYPADAIANEFLAEHFGEISPMKLQKLVYYAHAWHLALFDEKPLIESRIEAWPYGPVIQELYFEFREFGGQPIDRFAFELDEDLEEVAVRVSKNDNRTHALIKRIWELLKEKSAVELSTMTHSDREPWSKVPKQRPGLAIPNSTIAACFKNMINND